MKVGIHLPEVPGDLRALDAWRARLGASLTTVSIFQAWGTDRRAFDRAGLTAVRERGLVPMVTWEPWRTPGPEATHTVHQPDYSLRAIAGGAHDAYVHEWAEECRAWGAPMLLRPMHEMNGDWYPWCGTVNGNTPALYVDAWRRLHDIFASHHVRNVGWVWSPYVRSYREERGNAMEAYFPGDAYVDHVGLDGYNWGTRGGEHPWERFDTLFGPAYDRAAALSERPLLVAEVGCAEEGGDKAEWIAGMFETLRTRCPRVRSLVWFSVDKERDWRIDSSPAAASAFRRALDDASLARA